MDIIRRLTIVTISLLLAFSVNAQPNDWENPDVIGINKEEMKIIDFQL